MAEVAFWIAFCVFQVLAAAVAGAFGYGVGLWAGASRRRLRGWVLPLSAVWGVVNPHLAAYAFWVGSGGAADPVTWVDYVSSLGLALPLGVGVEVGLWRHSRRAAPLLTASPSSLAPAMPPGRDPSPHP